MLMSQRIDLAGLAHRENSLTLYCYLTFYGSLTQLWKSIFIPVLNFSDLQVKVMSSQLYLDRVALSAIGWYQKGPCVNYFYTIKF